MKPIAPRGSLPVPQTTLLHSLDVSAARYPDKTAVTFYGSTLSYRQLRAQVEALAGWLQAEGGVQRGDRVLLYLQNSPQFIVAYYAVLRADAVVVPVNPMNLADELRHYARDAGARLAIVGAELFERVAPLLDEGTLERAITAAYGEALSAPTDLALPESVRPATHPAHRAAVRWGDALAAGHAPGVPRATSNDLAVMPYTSGTTGQPKGCMHTHRSLMAVVATAGLLNGQNASDVMLAVVPFFHVTGMQMLMNAGLHLGAELVVMTRWDRELALQLIERHRVTAWTNIPTMVIDLLASPNATREKLASLRHIGGGGAAMPEAVAARLHALTGLDYIEGYGLTETAAPTHSNPMQRPKRQCLGMTIFNTDSRIVRPGTDEVLGPGEIGEIVTHAPQVFAGYWNNPQASAAAFVEIDGKRFFRTGDLGRRDDEGYFFLVDRLKRMINAAGYKVWPAEVEALLFAHPDIQEACVIGASDAQRGETVKACVVLKAASAGHVREDEIVAWAREHMAAYKVPRIVEFMAALPKTATGKVQWRVLQERENDRPA